MIPEKPILGLFKSPDSKVSEASDLREEISKHLVRVDEVDNTSKHFAKLFKEKLQVEEVSIIIYDDELSGYRNSGERTNFIEDQNKFLPFFLFLENEEKVIAVKTIKNLDKKVYPAMEKYLAIYKADIIIPLIFERRLLGLVNIVKKSYTKTDLNAFAKVMREITVSYTNSLLFSRMKKIYEETEEQNEKLRSLDRAKSVFLANVSHELRTPLISLKGYLELLIKEKLGSIGKKQANAIGVCIRNINRLERLINSILMYTQSEAGEMTILAERSNISKIASECIEEGSILAEQKGIEMKQEIQKDIWLKFDKDKIKQAIINMIANAIKFTQKGSVTLYLRKQEDKVLISVKDTGKGIPKDKLPYIFERFKRLDESPDKNFGGTGLGLAIVKAIVDLHKGDIHVDSELGKGTTITIEIPSQP